MFIVFNSFGWVVHMIYDQFQRAVLPASGHHSCLKSCLFISRSLRHPKTRSSMNPYTWTRQCWPTGKNLYQLCKDTKCILKDLPGAKDDKEVGKTESQGNLYCQWEMKMIMLIMDTMFLMGSLHPFHHRMGLDDLRMCFPKVLLPGGPQD